MIARIRKDFIPVALKAATVGNPPAGLEGQIYRELRRTRAAPQGICVMNSAGKALSWTLGFDDDDSLIEFFDHTKNRYDENPDSGLGCERYRRFPTARMDDVADDGGELKIPLAHATGERCPGELPIGDGSLAGRIVGRAYGDDGKPKSDARTQDNYIEDTVEITRSMQDELLTAAKSARARFRIPDSLAREIVSNAYLGMLDVNPLGGDRVRAELLAESISFWGEKQADGQLSIFGRSTVSAKNRGGIPGDTGRLWSHYVDLKWRGFAALDELGIKEIALVAEGQEELKWGGPGSAVSPDAAENPVAHLLGGRSLDFTTVARYGVSAER